MEGKILVLTSIMLFVFSISAFAAINETGDTSLLIVSVAPSVTNIELNDITTGDQVMDLSAAAETEFNCTATVTDADGNADINTIVGVLFGPSSSEGAADSDDDHYTDSSCDYNSGTGAAVCTFSTVEFYAEVGSWTCQINATDYAVNSNDTETDTASINTLLAIDISDALEIDFGSVGVGDDSTEQTTAYENEGNVQIDVDVDVYRDGQDVDDASGMSCDTGTIPAGNINASTVTGGPYTSAAASGLINLEENLDEATGDDQSPTTDNVFWKITVPTSGVAGTCDGTVYFGATST